MPVSGRPGTPVRNARIRRWLRVAAAAACCAMAPLASLRAAPPAGEAPSPEPAPAYEDQYLFEGNLPALEDAGPGGPQPLGRRQLAAELVQYWSDDDVIGEELEQGLRLGFSRETLNWGVLDADLQVVRYDNDAYRRTPDGTDTLVTFRQSAVPLSDELVLDNTFGHQRTSISPLLHGGFRYRLPSSPMFGLSGTLSLPSQSLRITSGETGFYEGVALPRFVESGGRLTTLAYEHRSTDRLELGGEVANLDGDDLARDHTSLLLAGRYTTADGRQEHALRLLADDDGNLGAWSDARHELGSLPGAGPVMRYGLFYFEPELAWTDAPIANDQLGLYLRADTGTSRYSLSGGYDYLETGLRSEAVTSSELHSVYFAGNLRASRALSLGLTGDVSTRSFAGVVRDEQLIWRLSSFASLGLRPGYARLEVFTQQLDSDIPTTERQRRGLRAGFDWRMPEKLRLSNELTLEWDEDSFGELRREELALLFRYDLLENLSWGMTASVFQSDGDRFATDRGLRLNADARWAFLPGWYASLSLNYNAAEVDAFFQDPVLGPVDAGQRLASESVWLTVGYRRATGQPYSMIGLSNGKAGTGSIGGVVFFDENRDGRRQLGERAVAGATLLLDGRYETRTDEQGRYRFAPVPTGPHELRLLTEELPLPWGLDDESPRRFEVGFRQLADLDFGVVSLN